MAMRRGHSSRRTWVPAAFFGTFAVVVLARLVQLQVLNHEAYALQAQAEQTGYSTIYARRGAILDRNGNVLAVSVDTWDVYVNSRAWKDQVKGPKAAQSLAVHLKLNPADLLATVSKGPGDVLIRRDLDYETGRAIVKENITGVVMLPNSARVNPEGDVGAPVLGFIGQDNIGLAGIESFYNEELMGKPGQAIFERDTTGEPIPFGQYIANDPEEGQDLVLTIDGYIQRLAEERLDAAIKEHRATGGSITVMDPSTGEILALASRPGLRYSNLDLNDPATLSLLKNVAVTDMYEPGSVMKVITAAAAIDKGVVSPDTTYVDTGITYIYDIPLRNFQDEAWGTQTMTGVLQHSINTGAVFMVQKLGAEVFQGYLDAFGFGKTTGIDFSGESDGIIRRPTDSDWSPVDLATQSFGQSISVTPIQMISAVAAAINGGNLITPHFVKARITAEGARHDMKPQIVGRAISAETSATIRTMLGAVVGMDADGTGRNPRNYTAGGKSGTANVPVINGYNDRQIISFVGFAPLERPKILILVKIDDNADGKTGTVAGGPIFARLTDDILRYMNVPPDKGPLKP